MGEVWRGQGLWVRWDIFGIEKEKQREKQVEMRRRAREEEEGEVGPRKSKMWRVRGKQRAGGTGAATLPPYPIPHLSLTQPSSPACAATMMQATVSEVCAKGKEVLL